MPHVSSADRRCSVQLANVTDEELRKLIADHRYGASMYEDQPGVTANHRTRGALLQELLDRRDADAQPSAIKQAIGHFDAMHREAKIKKMFAVTACIESLLQVLREYDQ
jgi:hypothetical protein